mmetsp:Transcript_25091/g.34420  ORF Transcript_25091/g.34420 Transcript_25091/m.34420 type:complete len:89 (+) Transcript_25091:113-379(+)
MTFFGVWLRKLLEARPQLESRPYPTRNYDSSCLSERQFVQCSTKLSPEGGNSLLIPPLYGSATLLRFFCKPQDPRPEQCCSVTTSYLP